MNMEDLVQDARSSSNWASWSGARPEPPLHRSEIKAASVTFKLPHQRIHVPPSAREYPEKANAR